MYGSRPLNANEPWQSPKTEPCAGHQQWLSDCFTSWVTIHGPQCWKLARARLRNILGAYTVWMSIAQRAGLHLLVSQGILVVYLFWNVEFFPSCIPCTTVIPGCEGKTSAPVPSFLNYPEDFNKPCYVYKQGILIRARVPVAYPRGTSNIFSLAMDKMKV